MDSTQITDLISRHVPRSIAEPLVSRFIKIRTDCITENLERDVVGKFVENVVQILQYLDARTYDQKPKVDQYLKNLESQQSNLPDDLKICCSRIARACYSLRNKRDIAHIGSTVNANIYDLRYIYSSCQWILTELIRCISGKDISTSAKIIFYIQLPTTPLVEVFGDRKIIYGELSASEEVLVYLQSVYPNIASYPEIIESLDRRAKSTVYNTLLKLWKDKTIHKEKNGYKLTGPGYRWAIEIIKSHSN